ncbi:Gfo/Idh/MocA family protein [Micromonospora cathayae]|uniref:Gfo/Idh/MocA family oxidoreductase n=1 Tax=Micromonospora cathayae TaxID=3028804 RepID=A0ABY7ZNH9_9ACTN|nr:Gfo/Idh/MocA family oxidoreductase [Micromonospora sp. HUAS 3]WDZ84505.1 Gfo/Idh/MocA family oxidoreductase [Micromonospora sp. HUAS 3]
MGDGSAGSRGGYAGRGPVRVGVLGCGNVSSRYVANLAGQPEVDVVACADADPVRARALAAAHALPEIPSVDDLLAHPGLDLVLNLTPPRVHAELTLRALAYDKHVYTEKPLATSLADARRILDTARARKLRVGTAPDTFLGTGPRTCADLVTRGAIGTPVSVNAAMMNAGPERFHPEPEFLYQEGAGPLFDIGPYYLTVLTALMGSVVRVGALGATARPERVVLTGPRAGSTFPVQTPTHVNTVLEFATGALGMLVTSFDVTATRTPHLEIHGTGGTIVAAQANSWGGPVLLRGAGDTDFTEVVSGPQASDGFMGMGLVDLARAILADRPALATAERGFHVLEVLTAIADSARDGGRFVPMTSTLEDPGGRQPAAPAGR